jgi:hypothetical protein
MIDGSTCLLSPKMLCDNSTPFRNPNGCYNTPYSASKMLVLL